MKYRDHKITKYFALALVLLSVSASLRLNASAQVRPVNDYGALGLGRLLKQLNTTASVMMVGAHPDDEDSALLAYLARGENARTAYLSLTRGDGGQNIIGPELFESLGVIRTEELLQARRLDGAEQYFTRAFDYGFSKTLAEAKSKWPEEVIKCDVVRAIRSFRPLVVISRFSGTPADGHGQHQYAGYITPLAVKAAADPKQCTEAGQVWQVLKFYREQGFGASDTAALKLNTGAYDPILGRTYFEIAMEGRSQHRSQGEGRLEYHGDQFSGLNLIDSKVAKVEKETSPFDGIDTSLTGSLKVFNASNAGADYLTQAQHAVKDATDNYKPASSAKILPILIKGFTAATSARIAVLPVNKAPRNIGLENEIDRKISQFSVAIQSVAGIQIDALAQNETVIPGDQMMISVKAFMPKNDAVKIGDITLTVPDRWSITTTDPPNQNNAAFSSREGAAATAVFNVKVDRDPAFTQPYWLDDPRTSDLYNWPATASQTLPFDPPQLVAHVKINLGGTDIILDQPVQYRFADPARGELRREVNLVPPVSVAISKDVEIIPLGGAASSRRVAVQITNNTAAPIPVTLAATDPGIKGFHASFAKPAVQVGPKSSVTTELDLQIAGNANPAPFSVTAFAVIDGGTYAAEMHVVSYPHIQTHRYYTRASLKLVPVDLKPVSGKIGYIMGSGDEVPEAIRQMGFDVTMLEEKDLASGDLSGFNSIVVGIRASETRADLVANNQRLLDYVKNGGNVIMQYQRGNWTGLAPFPVDMNDKQKTTAGSIARVVDEKAKVTILQPDNPIFNAPNKITEADFSGWVQERNAYNFVTFDPQYTPLLESHDAGEQENKGGLVIAKVGKGNWVYCSYSMFRQLPAGVPGAYRLFANMLSLPLGK
ncbi:MAG: PIG-L family deacetylase [Pyrinomonadaceae bacterium]